MKISPWICRLLLLSLVWTFARGQVVMAAPQIYEQPESQTVGEGTPAVFRVTASPAEKYQWHRDGNPVPGPAGSSKTLILNAAALSDSGVYHLVVTSGAESVASQPARLTVVPGADLRLVGTIPDEGNAMWVQVIGDTAYVADRYLRIYDVTDPANVVKLGEFGGGSLEIRSVFVSGTLACVTDFKSFNLILLDISNPAAPNEVGRIKLLNAPSDVVAREGLAYVATFRGMEIIDVSDPANPTRLSHWGTGVFFTVELVSDVVYLASNVPVGVGHVVDVSNPEAPQQLWSLFSPGWADTIKVRGNRLYVGGMENYIYDITDPRHPRFLGRTAANGNFGTAGMDVAGEFLLAGGNGLSIFDVSDPENPFLAGRYKSSTYKPECVAMVDHLIFVATSSGVEILEWSPASAAPVVTAPLAPVVAAKGSGAALFGHASGGEPLHWQWHRDGELLQDETNRVLHLPPMSEPNFSIYGVSAINSAGSTSLGTATVLLIEPAAIEGTIRLGDSRGPRITLQLPEGVQGEVEVTSDFQSWSTVWSGQVRETPMEVFDTYGGKMPQRTYRFRYGLPDDGSQ